MPCWFKQLIFFFFWQPKMLATLWLVVFFLMCPYFWVLQSVLTRASCGCPQLCLVNSGVPTIFTTTQAGRQAGRKTDTHTPDLWFDLKSFPFNNSGETGMDVLETAVTDCTFRSSPGLVMCEVHSLKRLGSGSEPWCPHAHKGKE